MAWENVFFDGGVDVKKKWDGYSATGTIDNPTLNARHGRCIHTSGVYTIYYYKNFTASRKFVVGFAAMMYNTVGNKIYLDFCFDSDVQIRIELSAGQHTKAFRGTSSELASSTTYINYDNLIYKYFECEIFIDSTAGYIKAKMDGIVIIDITGINTQELTGNTINRTKITSDVVYNSNHSYIDDLYVRTGETTDSDGFLGDIRIDAIVPTADTSKEFTPSTGTDNYACIDEIPASETDYVTSGEYGTKDIYRFTNTLSLPGRIIAVQQNTLAKKSTTGISQGLKHVVRVNGTDYKKDAFTPDSTSQYFYDIWETNPDNDNEWDIEDINALDAGLIAES